MRPLLWLITLELAWYAGSVPADEIPGDHGGGGSGTVDTTERPAGEAPLSTDDPDFDGKMVSRLFRRPIDAGRAIAGELLQALERGDDARFADVVAVNVNPLPPDEKERMLTELLEHSASDEVLARPKSRDLVNRLLWSLEEELGEPRNGSALRDGFKDDYQKAAERAKKRAEQFATQLDKAARGDAAARDALRGKFSDRDLLDFMKSQRDGKGTKLAETFGWKDVHGVTHLDVKKPGESEIASIALGKTPSEIARSLSHGGLLDGASLARRGADGHAPKRKFVKPNPKTGKLEPVKPDFIPPEHNFLCAGAPKKETAVTPSGRPVYFFRPFAGSPVAGYATSAHRNQLIDLQTGKEFGEVPGPYDPVPTPDDIYLTVPEHGANKGLTFYTTQSVKAGKPNQIFVDTDMHGVYQSIGKLASANDTYRVIIANAQDLFVRDYRITAKPGLTGAKVEPLGARLPLCPGFKLATPMISKDGSQLAALDLDSQTTKVYDVKSDGSCTETLDLGIHTGKVDFSYQEGGRYLAFHKYAYLPENPGSYISVPSDRLVGNVYVYDKLNGKVSRVTHNTDSNAVYPSWRADGTLVYIRHPHGAAKDSEEKSQLVSVKPAELESQPMDFFNQTPEVLAERAALGGLWNYLCSPHASSIDRESAALGTLSLDADRCRFMVDNHWENFRADVSATERFRDLGVGGLPKDRLMKLCGEMSAPPPQTPSTTPTSQRGAVFQSCNACHGERFHLPFENPARMGSRPRSANSLASTLTDEIKRRLELPAGHADRMPPANQPPLSDRERRELDEFLAAL